MAFNSARKWAACLNLVREPFLISRVLLQWGQRSGALIPEGLGVAGREVSAAMRKRGARVLLRHGFARRSVCGGWRICNAKG